VSWLTSIFMHGSWDHILGNMLFLAIFGKNVEDALGHARYLAFYLGGGFVATMTQTLMTLAAGTASDGRVPTLGASGAIAAVLGAYFVLYPGSRILTVVFVFVTRIPAWIFLGLWFLYQLVEANFGLFSASANGGGSQRRDSAGAGAGVSRSAARSSPALSGNARASWLRDVMPTLLNTLRR
jgi:rhomboid family protein